MCDLGIHVNQHNTQALLFDLAMFIFTSLLEKLQNVKDTCQCRELSEHSESQSVSLVIWLVCFKGYEPYSYMCVFPAEIILSGF